MSSTNNPQSPSELVLLNSQQRYDHLHSQIRQTEAIWIIIGDGGSVLLNSDDRSCVPVWPSKECAELMIQGDWSDCKTLAITAEDWQARWTSGLSEDDLAIACYPNLDDECLVISPQEFEANVFE